MRLVAVTLLIACGAQASIFEGTTGDYDYRIDGRLRETVGLGYSRILGGSRFQLIDNSYLAELATNFSWRNEIRFKAVLNLQGDAIYRLRRNSGTFGTRNVDVVTGQNGVFVPYGRNASDSESFREDCRNSPDCNLIRDQILRELSIVFANKKLGYNITIGKFQRGLGQADGLRLADIINPLDFRKRFLLRDFDELRIEQWMIDAIIFTDPFVNLNNIGIQNPNLEFIAIPNVRHAEFNINNAYNDEAGGIWAFDLPSEDFGFDGERGRIPDGAYFNLTRLHANKDWFSTDPHEWAYAARVAWTMFHGEYAITGYYGWQDLFVTRLQSADVFAGPSGGRDGGALLLNASPALSETAYYTGIGTGAVDLGSNCSAFGILPVPGGCSVVGNVTLDFRERKRLVGFQATREISLLRIPPKDVSPVLRVEASYEWDKPFNTPRLVAPDSVAVKEKDFLSVMVGEDFFLWVPTAFYYIPWVQEYIYYQPRGIFSSFQLFWFKVMGNGSGDSRVLFQSPYPDWKRPTNEFWMTFLFFTDVYGDKIHLEGLNVYEVTHSSYILRQRADIKLFGDNFFPRLEFIHFEGGGDQVGGVFDSNDMVAIDFLYQF